MNMKSLKTQFIGAIAMVLVAAIAMGSSTYAWFSMNSKVTVTGMEVRTQVKDDLLIAPCDVDATTLSADNTFNTSYTHLLKGILEPVSTVNGVNYFYNSTKNTEKSGDAITNNYIAYVENDAFDANYGFTTAGTQEALGYVDHAFQIKATNTQGSDQTVKVTGLNLIYGGTETTQQAFRVAIFVDDMGSDGTTAAAAGPYYTDSSTTNLLSIVRTSTAKYFGAAKDNAVEAVSAVNAAPTAVDGKIDDAITIGTVAARTTNYYKVVVRLWLEGEDTTCNNSTFAVLEDKWELDMVIELGTGAGVTNINQTSTASKLSLAIGTDDGIDTGALTLVGVTYYPISGKTLNGNQLYVSADKTLAANSRIFRIIDNLYPVDVTNQVSIS